MLFKYNETYKMTPVDAAVYVSSDGAMILFSISAPVRAFSAHFCRADKRAPGAAITDGEKSSGNDTKPAKIDLAFIVKMAPKGKRDNDGRQTIQRRE